MPKQLIQWQCEICGLSLPGWTEADAMKCEQSHRKIECIQEVKYAHPGDKYPSRILVLFDDGDAREFVSRDITYLGDSTGNSEGWHHSAEGKINLQE